jgi:hypothetical protein
VCGYLVVLDYETFPSKFEGRDEFAVILIQHNGKQPVTTTSSRVIIDQLAKIKYEMPVKVQGKYSNNSFIELCSLRRYLFDQPS